MGCVEFCDAWVLRRLATRFHEECHDIVVCWSVQSTSRLASATQTLVLQKSFSADDGKRRLNGKQSIIPKVAIPNKTCCWDSSVLK